MKSIVLCERTLVHESEDFSTLKDGKADEIRKKVKVKGKAKGKRLLNGISSSKKSIAVKKKRKKTGNCNHESTKSSETFKQGVNSDDGKKSELPTDLENGTSEKPASNGTESSVENASSDLCTDGGEEDCLVSSFEDKVAESGKQSSSEQVQDSLLNCQEDFSLVKVAVCDETGNDKSDSRDVTEVQWENSIGNSDGSSLKESLSVDTGEDKEGDKDSVVNIVVDVDENKENKNNQIEGFSGSESLNKQSSECEIQVGDVQSITDSEKNSMWVDNDFKSSAQDLKEAAGKKRRGRSQDVPSPNEDTTGGDEENAELEIHENVVSEAEENIEESIQIDEEKEEEGSERAQKPINEEDKNYVTNLDKLSPDEIATDAETESVQEKKENVVCRKRQPSNSDDSDPSVKKKRLSRGSEEAVQVPTEDEEMETSSLCEGPASADVVSATADQVLPKAEVVTTKRTSTKDKIGKKLKPSEEVKEELEAEGMFSVLERFRGSLKTLTRSDLEELIVQKLCEVITERSNVGELRRRAQALEQDQERWKSKIQALTKQMREMEMVMKKYMTEVQKQVKEGDPHVVTPLKVTRSVGLQVSFYSSASKGPKPGLPQPSTPSSPAQNVNARNPKVSPPKLPSQYSPPNQNTRNKYSPYQKGSPTVQKSFSQQKRSIVPQPDYISPQSNRAMPKSLLNNSRGVQNQVSRTNYKSASGATATTTTTTTSASTVQQQQQQSGSKVIDLTDDDDRQTGSIVKTSGPIRVVNHLTQGPTPQGNRYAYLLPTTSASTATSGGQGRQVLIAAPTMPQPSRQIMCSMPPLFFKGGNVVQSGSQSHVINQSNKVILPKVLRHPAPLPQQPVNQNTRPNLKLLPPRPALKISKVQTGIVLSWNMSLSPEHAPIASYQLYAYQESNCPPATSLWKKVGDVKALPLPMACTLTQFMSGHKYHFAVRAVDLHSRIGPFSFPGTIVLVK